ncbi:MAG: hypothetical protein IJZ23_11015 [Roseburia sp.]|nr:hypothetical protein [Roseburia sp.]
MDKYEYNLKLDQMKSLVAEGDYQTAAEIADTINWRKIKNVTALVRAGEIYEQVERYEESKEILLMAYDRSPIGRTIIYRLACVAIKMADFEEAKDYYREFVEIAPHDNLKYVLKYEINKAQGSDYKTLIANLEELREQELSEEWGFELAYMYHQAGMGEKCIEICDELILYFGQGPYVERALELKMLYQPLTRQQEERYRQFRQQKEGITEVRPDDMLESGEIVTKPVQIPQVQLSPERFNTQNLQEALQESMQKIMEATEKETVDDHMDAIKKLVEEIPYLQIPVEKEEEELHIATDREIDDSLKLNFQELLNEEYDGQMSILVPEHGVYEPQITGQMTIEDVLAEWEKTRRAAAAALQEAEQKKLESAKARALQEAGDIMERLVDVIPKLDSGFTPQDLLKEQYLSDAEVEEDSAAQMVANMNQLLQKEIDRLSTENTQIDEQLAVAQEFAAAQELAAAMQEMMVEEPVEEAVVAPEAEPAVQEELLEEEHEADFLAEMAEEFAAMAEAADEEAAGAVEATEPEEDPVTEEVPMVESILPKLEFPMDIDLSVAIEAETKSSEQIAAASKITKLSDEQKTMFSYFTPIRGMEEQICTALSGIATRIEQGTSARTGNLIIQGGSGSGKTVFATNFIKALQQMTGRTDGKVGKIEAEVLNKKDVNALYSKIAGGCLIIESAGELAKDTAVKLSLLLEHDTQGTLLVLEDTKSGIEKALVRDKGFASKFTERVNIPIFTNDELVVFAKAYAKENGYRIDEMGVLAVYNCISNIQKLDRETTIAEVKEIVDDAITHVESGTFRKAFSILTSSRFDEEDYVILHEKDFNI